MLFGRRGGMVWNGAGSNGLSGRVAIGIGADNGPIVPPTHGLEMHDAAVGAVGLKVYKPALTIGSFDITALVRSVDLG